MTRIIPLPVNFLGSAVVGEGLDNGQKVPTRFLAWDQVQVHQPAGADLVHDRVDGGDLNTIKFITFSSLAYMNIH